MKIVLTGATGFIGNRLRRALFEAGHEVVCMGRHADPARPCHAWVAADFAAPQPAAWAHALAGAHCVINTVGLLRESSRARFSDLHGGGPRALFDACVDAGVSRVIHFSALGAEATASTEFQRSKHALDEYLMGLPLQAFIVQPSLVFGLDGASSRHLLTLASLPLLPLPARGDQWLQPIHVDDVVAAVLALLLVPMPQPPLRRVPLVGAHPITLADYLHALRRGLQLGRGVELPVPALLMRGIARLGDAWPRALLDSPAWSLLQRGSIAPPQMVTALLMRPPRPASGFIAPEQAADARRDAQLRWLLPLARASLAFVWIASGVVALGIYSSALALLGRAGVPAEMQSGLLVGAALLDLVLGLLTLWPVSRPRLLWLLQALLILTYTAIVSWRLPEFWLHPFGPLAKNVPMLALLGLLSALGPTRPARR